MFFTMGKFNFDKRAGETPLFFRPVGPSIARLRTAVQHYFSTKPDFRGFLIFHLFARSLTRKPFAFYLQMTDFSRLLFSGRRKTRLLSVLSFLAMAMATTPFFERHYTENHFSCSLNRPNSSLTWNIYNLHRLYAKNAFHFMFLTNYNETYKMRLRNTDITGDIRPPNIHTPSGHFHWSHINNKTS